MEGNTLEQLVFEDYFNDPSADNLALMISCSCNLRVCERQTKQLGHLPILKYAAASIATPADAALMMQLGCEGVFVGSGVFNSLDPVRRARAIVQAVNKLGLGLFDMGAYCLPYLSDLVTMDQIINSKGRCQLLS